MTRPSKPIATFPAMRTLAAMVAPLWMIPAATVNVDWAAGILSPWNVAAVASIAAAALFVAAAFQAKSQAAAVAFAVAAGLLTLVNTVTAFTNATHRTSDVRDHRATEIATIEGLKLRRSQWSQGRNSAAMVAGERPAATIAAEIDQVTAANARRWASTGRCDPGSITARDSMRFCERLAALQGQLAAAQRRDALDAQIERLDREAAELAAPASSDPFTDATGNLAAALGLPLSPELASALPALRDGLRALALELIGTLGPAAWLMLWSDKQPQQQTPAPKPLRATTRREVPKRSTVKPADQLAAFVTARLENDADEAVRAGEVWSAWQAWCAEHNADAGSQKKFGQAMACRFKHDRNGGRPVYRGARLRGNAEFVPPTEKRVLPFASRAKAMASR